MKLNLNASLWHVARARALTALKVPMSCDDDIRIVELDAEANPPYARLSTGEIFYHREHLDPRKEIFSRFVFSHYELQRVPHKKYAIHLNHVDNLHNLPVDGATRERLLLDFPVRSGDTVLELGAFCGFGTMKLARLVGEQGRVIAVEADPENYAILCKNVEANRLANVTTVNRGIWSAAGRSVFYTEGQQRNSLVSDLLKRGEPGTIIETDTVDNILAAHDAQEADFIPMEINAAEIEALRGMPRTLANPNLRLVAAGWYDYQGRPGWQWMKEILADAGFEVHVGVQNRVYALKGRTSPPRH